MGDLDNGQYSYERGSLLWKIPVIDDKASVGTMEFTTPGGKPDSFFPIKVNFTCGASLVGVEVRLSFVENNRIKIKNNQFWFAGRRNSHNRR